MTEQLKHNSLLKETREAKGLTLEIVHEATKIPLDALKAIEQGYSVRSLTPFYLRGFIKIYAEFLGLDPQEMLKAYGLNVPKAAGGASLKESRTVKQSFAAEQCQEFLAAMWTAKNRKFLLRLLSAIIGLFVLVKCIGCVSGHFKREKSRALVPSAQPVSATVETAKGDFTGRKVSLAVRAIKNSWIQVRVDGKVVFEMTMKKGTMESWTGKEQIEISGKNIATMDMEVNGKHIGALGSSERGAKTVIITKGGLTVKK